MDEEHSLHTCSSHRPQGCKWVLCILYHFQLYSNPEIWIKCCSLHRGRKKGRTGLVTQLRRLNFYIIISEIKPEEAHFPGKQHQRTDEMEGLREVCLQNRQSCLKKAIKHDHWIQIPAKFHYIWPNFQFSVQSDIGSWNNRHMWYSCVYVTFISFRRSHEKHGSPPMVWVDLNMDQDYRQAIWIYFPFRSITRGPFYQRGMKYSEISWKVSILKFYPNSITSPNSEGWLHGASSTSLKIIFISLTLVDRSYFFFIVYYFRRVSCLTLITYLFHFHLHIVEACFCQCC